MARARTPKQKAALRKAQLISARRRKGTGKGTKKGKYKKKSPKVKRSAGRAYQAGLALGLSKKLNSRAGFTGNADARVTKKGTYDKRHRIRKNTKRRAAGYVAGVATTAAVLGVAHAGLSQYATKKGYVSPKGKSSYRTRL